MRIGGIADDPLYTISSDVDIRPPTHVTFKTDMDKRWDLVFYIKHLK